METDELAFWIGYALMAIAYGWAFDYSVAWTQKTRGARMVAHAFAVLVGACWLGAMPVFAFVSMIMQGNRGRRA